MLLRYLSFSNKTFLHINNGAHLHKIENLLSPLALPLIQVYLQNFIIYHNSGACHFRDVYPMLLVANKVDLVHLRKISKEQGQALAQQLGVPYIETSAKDPPLNIDETFHEVRFFEYPIPLASLIHMERDDIPKPIDTTT